VSRSGDSMRLAVTLIVSLRLSSGRVMLRSPEEDDHC
jgi:hypothetical protein